MKNKPGPAGLLLDPFRQSEGEAPSEAEDNPMRIILLCILAAVGYGILHDTVTAHVCVEYFTLAHPRVIPSENPFAMALIWGVLATWWVGLGLGIGLAAASTLGSRPRVEAAALAPKVARLLLVMAAVALTAGGTGFVASKLGWIQLVPPLSEQIPKERWGRFFFDAFAHLGSYAGGLLGGLFLIVHTWRGRLR